MLRSFLLAGVGSVLADVTPSTGDVLCPTSISISGAIRLRTAYLISRQIGIGGGYLIWPRHSQGDTMFRIRSIVAAFAALIVSALAPAFGEDDARSSAHRQDVPHGEIIWDKFGIPHIYGQTTEDVL